MPFASNFFRKAKAQPGVLGGTATLVIASASVAFLAAFLEKPAQAHDPVVACVVRQFEASAIPVRGMTRAPQAGKIVGDLEGGNAVLVRVTATDTDRLGYVELFSDNGRAPATPGMFTKVETLTGKVNAACLGPNSSLAFRR